MFEACTLHPPPIPPPYIAARNLDALCYSVILVAQDHCQEALHDALVIEMKHKMFDFYMIARLCQTGIPLNLVNTECE